MGSGIYSTIVAIIFGIVMGLFRTSRSPFKRLVGWSYVELIRNIPILVWIFIFYYFISDQFIPMLGLDHLEKSTPGFFKAILSLQRWVFMKAHTSRKLSEPVSSPLKTDSGRLQPPSDSQDISRSGTLFCLRQPRGYSRLWPVNSYQRSRTLPSSPLSLFKNSRFRVWNSCPQRF